MEVRNKKKQHSHKQQRLAGHLSSTPGRRRPLASTSGPAAPRRRTSVHRCRQNAATAAATNNDDSLGRTGHSPSPPRWARGSTSPPRRARGANLTPLRSQQLRDGGRQCTDAVTTHDSCDDKKQRRQQAAADGTAGTEEGLTTTTAIRRGSPARWRPLPRNLPVMEARRERWEERCTPRQGGATTTTWSR